MFRRFAPRLLTALVLLLSVFVTARTAHASLVANGSFENTAPLLVTTQFLSAGVANWTNSNIGESLVLPNWYTNGCLYCPNVSLAGPFPQTSPDGGNFVLS